MIRNDTLCFEQRNNVVSSVSTIFRLFNLLYLMCFFSLLISLRHLSFVTISPDLQGSLELRYASCEMYYSVFYLVCVNVCFSF